VICFFCTRVIRGADLNHRAEWRRADDGTVKVYGEDAPDGPLTKAQGRLVKVCHKKCFHAECKRLELLAAKAADPEGQPPAESDWRHQDVVDVEERAGEGHRDSGGAVPPGR
jgi:hypothetical protein